MAKGNDCLRSDGEKKERWPNETAAQFVADWKRLKFGNALYVYECPNCAGWHLSRDKSVSHSVKAKAKRRQKERARIRRRRDTGR